MDLKQSKFYKSLSWIKITVLVCLPAMVLSISATEYYGNKREQIHVQPMVQASAKPTTSLKKVKFKPWYTKINYFVLLGQDKRDIAVSRKLESRELDRELENESDSELFKADYNATLLSFTAGGNLFNRTSLHFDLTFNKFTLDGDIIGVTKEAVRYQRNKTLVELFVEHDLGKGVTLGGDLYYGGDYYKNKGEPEKFYDEEFGGGLLASSKFKLGSFDARLDYIFSYRGINPGNNDYEKSSRSFHNLLFSLSHQWSYELSTDLNTRVSYYPDYDLTQYWDAHYVYALATEIHYRVWDSDEVSLRIERMNFAGGSYVNSLSLRFEHQFGAKKSKRRKRRHKIPNLLIK